MTRKARVIFTYEEIYLNAYDSVSEAKSGVKAGFNF
jgi:hypothetical protein